MHQATSAPPIRVRFAAGQDRSGPLTLGQRNVLAWIDRQGRERSDVIWTVFAAPAGITPDDVADVARVLVERHEVLRTTYTADSAAGGEPVQRVAGAGELAVEVREQDPGAAPPSILNLDEEWKRPFDLATEFGVRVGVFTIDGRPTRIVLALSHVAADFAALEILARELRHLLARPDVGALPPAHQPLAQAANERSPAGLRRAEASLRHWDTVLRKAPQCLFSLPPDPAGHPGQRQAVLRSRAAALAIARITARTGAGHSPVLLAAAATLLAHRTGNDMCALVSLSGNRFGPGGRDYVGTIAQDALVYLELADAVGFDDVVRQARTATLRAYRHAQFEAARLYEVIGRAEYERGTRFHRDCVFSDLSVHRGAAPAGPDGDGTEDLRALMADSELRFVDEHPREPLFQFELYELAEHATLMLLGDTRHLPERQIEAFLRGVERLLVAAADTDLPLAEVGAVTGLPAPTRGEGWVRVDSCWVRLDSVRRLLEDLPLVRRAHVTVEDDGGHSGPTLTARVVPADPAIAVEELHLTAVARLRDRHTAIAPHRYLLYAYPPGATDDPDDPASWHHPLAAGTGRSATPPAGRPEELR